MATATRDAAANQEWGGGASFGTSTDLPESDIALGRRRGMDEKQREKMQKLQTLMTRLAITGVRTAYVINMNPYSLKVNGVLLDDTIVPACPLGQDHIIFPIAKPMIAWRDDKDGDETPVEFLPVMLVRDFEHLYYKKGGVVVFEASGNPKRPVPPEQEIAENPDLQEKIAAARSRMFNFASERYMAMETALRVPGSSAQRDVNDTDRALAALLLHNRLIPEAPKWFAPTKQEQDLVDPCARCKAEPKKGATMCAACGYILDPAQAFKLGDLDVTNEVDKRALMRLSRKQLDELNISQFIEENLEERDERLAKEAKKGKQKQQEQKV